MMARAASFSAVVLPKAAVYLKKQEQYVLALAANAGQFASLVAAGYAVYMVTGQPDGWIMALYMVVLMVLYVVVWYLWDTYEYSPRLRRIAMWFLSVKPKESANSSNVDA